MQTIEIDEVDQPHQETPANTKRQPIAIGGRRAIGDAIVNNVAELVASAGSPLLTAREVLDVMKAKKLMSSLVLANLRGANGVGDVLGHKYLDLPFILRGTKRFYLIPAAGWNDETKASFDDLSPKEQAAELEKIIAEHSEGTEG
jgi:hypothetical protein